MTKLTDEKLREYADRGNAMTYEWRMIATELLEALALLRECRPRILEIFPHGTLRARIDAFLESAQ